MQLPLPTSVSALSAPRSSFAALLIAVACAPRFHAAAAPAVDAGGPPSVPCWPAEASKNRVLTLTLQAGLEWSFREKDKARSFKGIVCIEEHF